MTDGLLASLGGTFSMWDWGVVIAYFALTTYIGHALAGKQATIRDFFLGGRKLPWYAVSGSIIATEISAVTFICVPFVVFNTGGNFTYLQLGVFGTVIARLIVGYVLVPAYYKREIYSPYDYMGNQLGNVARSASTVLFSIGGILGQSARVYLTALILNIVLKDQLDWLSAHTHVSALAWSVIFIGAVSVSWTLMGGISTVIWTDLMLFLVFVVGAVFAFFTICSKLDGGLSEVIRVGQEANKFQFWDFRTDWTVNYTLLTGIIASTWGGLGVYGTDQMIAQRMFCCKSERAARWAIITSSASQLVTFTVLMVGAALFAYYQVHPLQGDQLELYNAEPNRIFAIFIVSAMPVGIKGLIIAGVFAAAISSLDSIMAALSQTFMSAFYLPLRKRKVEAMQAAAGDAFDQDAEDARTVRMSRIFILISGVLLCFMTFVVDYVNQYYESILDLALALASYATGGLFAGFALAFLPLKVDGRGFAWSSILSVFTVFALVWHQPRAQQACIGAACIMLVVWFIRLAITAQRDKTSTPVLPVIPRTIVLIAGLAMMICVCFYGHFGSEMKDGEEVFTVLAWPWYSPIGSIVAFTWGYLLAHKKTGATTEHD
ncbi:MAG TPA: hypothetical protein PKN33_11120 [Phycisphaerae bacterium]|nr:hypothetical protein [Phycisphaerae bacterium]